MDLGELGHSTLKRDAKGNYCGKLTQPGATAITCLMTGGIDSIINKYEIGIRWIGTELVNSIKADKLTVSSGSTKYWSNSFAFNTGTSVAGYRPIGYVVIPPNVKKVKIISGSINLK